MFCRLTGSQDLVTFWACHRAAFEHFGGVPHELLYERTKTVVRQHLGKDVRIERRIFHSEGGGDLSAHETQAGGQRVPYRREHEASR